MKNRKIPFGYRYEEGKIAVQQTEAEVLNGICTAYCTGNSLQTIAEELNAKGVEYMPGVTGWNKARLKRLLEDARYLGSDMYPALIAQEVYAQIKTLKATKSTQRMVDRSAPVFQITVPVICTACGAKMKRRNDCRCKQAHRWACSNSECSTLIPKDDRELLSDITALLNKLIDEPEMIKIPDKASTELSLASRTTKNSIARMLNEVKIDQDAVRQQMMAYVAHIYNDIDSAWYAIRRLKEEFARAKPLEEFSPWLFNDAVQEIRMHGDTTISIVLINGQIIGKERS